MLANLVRLALVVELAAWAWVGGLLGARSGLPPWAAAAACIAGAAGVRLALVCFTFLAAWLARSPRGAGEAIGPLATAAMLAGEWRAMLGNNFLGLPFERTVPRPDPPLAPGGRVPVVVLHGYFSNRGTVRALVRALDEAGVAPVVAPSLPCILAPVEEFAANAGRVVEEIASASGQPKVILVCHSMGGLIAREYLRRHGAGRVAGLVTLGSPHHGSALARIGAGANARQMRPGSDFLRALERSEGEEGPGIPVLSIYTRHDNLVAPQDSSRLPWARHVAISGVGHLAMLDDARVHGAVVEELRRLGAGPPR
jgi:pimeloyl-ACP methyl ester carboxylesterase